jgi:hypothetical protein
VGGAVGFVELLKLLLDLGGAGRTGEVESTAITVVDTINIVGTGDLWPPPTLAEL